MLILIWYYILCFSKVFEIIFICTKLSVAFELYLKFVRWKVRSEHVRYFILVNFYANMFHL